MESLISLVRLRNTGLVNAGKYRITMQVGLEDVDPQNIALVHWIRSPITYSVRNRTVTKPRDAVMPCVVDDACATSVFFIEYDEEDVNMNETCLFHLHVTAKELLERCSHSTTRITFTLEYYDDVKTVFTRVGNSVLLDLEGDRYGLMNECAILYFTSPTFGSASLELSVYFASLLRHAKPQSIFTEEELMLDAGEHFTLAARKLLKRRLAQFSSPYTSSLAKLRSFAQFCSSSASSSMLLQSKNNSLIQEEGEIHTASSSQEKDDDATTVLQLCLEMEANENKSESFFLWHRIQSLFAQERETLFDISRERWMQKARDLAGEWSLREKIPSPQALLLPQDAAERAMHYHALAERLRLAPRFSDHSDDNHVFAGASMFVDEKGRPVVFEQRFEHASRTPYPPPPEEGIHVIVLLHGFLGSRWDLKVFQLVLASLEIPGTRCRAMGCNEHSSEQSLENQGASLAAEILTFCEDKNVTRLSFVAYSMGAVIARFALNDARMQQRFHNKLYTFISVAGPHLGSSGSDSALVGVGQWVFRRWKKILSLSQLALEDDTMVELAKKSEILSKFQTIALVSSSSDAYVPSYSARIEVPTTTTGLNPKIVEMQRALCANLLKVRTLSKIELDFQFETQSTRQRMDVLLGRAAHVHILDSIPLTLTLMLNYGDEWFK